MNITEFFAFLNVPLNNKRWSWGGFNSQGALIVKAGASDFNDGRLWLANEHPGRQGDVERTGHVIWAIATKAPVFAVHCLIGQNAKGEEVVTRFDKSELRRIENIVLEDGRYYGTVTGKVKSIDVRNGAY